MKIKNAGLLLARASSLWSLMRKIEGPWSAVLQVCR
jgi:hypothetical protein